MSSSPPLEPRPFLPAWLIRKTLLCVRERRLPSCIQVQISRMWRILSPKQRRYHTEIDFWTSYMSAIKNLTEVEMEKVFPASLKHLIEEHYSHPPDLLEVGPGPFSLLTWGAQHGLFRIVAVDPLAAEYRRICESHQITPSVQPVQGDGEHLGDLFPAHSFDIVYSSNALDHTRSPRRCMENMSSVVRYGGFIMIEGYIREGSASQWQGLHHFDLVPTDKTLLCYRQNGHCDDLISGLPLTCIHSKIDDADRRRNQTATLIRDGRANWLTMVFEKVT